MTKETALILLQEGHALKREQIISNYKNTLFKSKGVKYTINGETLTERTFNGLKKFLALVEGDGYKREYKLGIAHRS